MNVLENKLADLGEAGKKALAAFFTAGYPTLDESLSLARAAAKAGADVIEIGVPFSDPVADGPTIQRSSKAALDAGATLSGLLDALGDDGAGIESPVALMSYLNPVMNMGFREFADRAAAAGVSGVIVPDAPVGQAEELRKTLADRKICTIFLVAPTSGDDRVRSVAEATSGFLYAIPVTGVTGARGGLSDESLDFVERVKSLCQKPVLAGFGVSSPEQAVALCEHADGVIVGSALVELCEQGPGEVAKLVDRIKRGLRSMDSRD